jgi:DNA-binding response OmpR family regulator
MKQPRILVVDDDHLMLTLLIGLLRKEGYLYVDKASLGKEAITKFLQTRPEVIFLDIELPDFNGIETLKAIREYGTVCQVVMVTATATAQLVKAARELGASGFLVKPVSAAKITGAIKICLERALQEEGSIEFFNIE